MTWLALLGAHLVIGVVLVRWALWNTDAGRDLVHDFLTDQYAEPSDRAIFGVITGMGVLTWPVWVVLGVLGKLAMGFASWVSRKPPGEEGDTDAGR